MKLDRNLLVPTDPARAAAQIGTGRIAIGAVIMAAPVLSLRLMGTDSATAKRVNWLTRMTGARDGVLGAGTLLASRNAADAAVPWLLAGAVADLVDAAATAGALRRGRLRGIVPVGMVGFAGASAALGAGTALRLRRR